MIKQIYKYEANDNHNMTCLDNGISDEKGYTPHYIVYYQEVSKEEYYSYIKDLLNNEVFSMISVTFSWKPNYFIGRRLKFAETNRENIFVDHPHVFQKNVENMQYIGCLKDKVLRKEDGIIQLSEDSY